MIKEITKENFEQEVLKARKLVLVDFWGQSCAPCQALIPHLEKLAEKYSGELKVVKVNVVGNRMLCMKLQILSLPTLLFYKNGKEMKRLSGNIQKQTLEKTVEELL